MVNPTKFEINLVRGSQVAMEMQSLANFMSRYRCGAVVVDPAFVEAVMIDRLRVNGKYKIVTAIDFSGSNFSTAKFRGLPRVVLESDGFDVLLSVPKQESDGHNELKAVHEFIRKLNPLAEIRWTLGLRSRPPEKMSPTIQYFPKFPAEYVRTDHNVFIPDVTLIDHELDIDLIRAGTGTPIKISNGVTLETIERLGSKVAAYDVTLTQAKELIRQSDRNEQADEETRRGNQNGLTGAMDNEKRS